MVLSPYSRHRASRSDLDGDLESMQDNIEEFTRRLVEQPGLDSFQLDNISLTNGTTVLVEHKLGRNYVGWRIVDNDTSAIVFRDATSTADTSKYLALDCSANCVVSIEVF